MFGFYPKRSRDHDLPLGSNSDRFCRNQGIWTPSTGIWTADKAHKLCFNCNFTCWNFYRFVLIISWRIFLCYCSKQHPVFFSPSKCFNMCTRSSKSYIGTLINATRLEARSRFNKRYRDIWTVRGRPRSLERSRWREMINVFQSQTAIFFCRIFIPSIYSSSEISSSHAPVKRKLL